MSKVTIECHNDISIERMVHVLAKESLICTTVAVCRNVFEATDVFAAFSNKFQDVVCKETFRITLKTNPSEGIFIVYPGFDFSRVNGLKADKILLLNCDTINNSSVSNIVAGLIARDDSLDKLKLEAKQNRKPHKKLPPLVISLCWDCDGWIVGSTADFAAGKGSKADGSDYDVVVSADNWNKASHICMNSDKVVVNSFGGLKCTSNGVEVDVWMDNVADLMAHHHVKSAFHPNTRTYISREKQ